MIDSDFYGYDNSGETGLLIFEQDFNGDGIADGYVQLENFDLYGNPHTVSYGFDSDGNGILDTFMQECDTDGDGITDNIMRANDYDQDGNYDNVQTYSDTDGDGVFDLHTNTHVDNNNPGRSHYTDIFLDADADGKADVSMRQEFIDTDGDGVADTRRDWVNESGGKPTEGYFADSAYDPADNSLFSQPVLADEPYFTTSELYGTGLDQFNPEEADMSQVSGDPVSDMQHWEYQGETARCAIYSQKFVIEAVTGREVDIEELVAVAEENGWFNEAAGGGTTSLNMDKLLQYYGVESDMYFDADIDSLKEALDNGQKVIVSLDSGQVWKGEDNNIFSPNTVSDHAVEVIGIDYSDPENPMVILNDSGSPTGCGELVALETFENAWSAGDHQMIVCQA